ncbi:MAG: hypothetical protein IJO79_00680 [Firmicutes bacterium]|nr:hypothetical protein [Bacillota bacterium]
MYPERFPSIKPEDLLYQEIQLLELINDHGSIQFMQLAKSGILDEYDTKIALETRLNGYVHIDNAVDAFVSSNVKLTYLGESVLLNRRKERLSRWIPFAVATMISVFSAAVSVVSAFAK